MPLIGMLGSIHQLNEHANGLRQQQQRQSEALVECLEEMLSGLADLHNMPMETVDDGIFNGNEISLLADLEPADDIFNENETQLAAGLDASLNLAMPGESADDIFNESETQLVTGYLDSSLLQHDTSEGTSF